MGRMSATSNATTDRPGGGDAAWRRPGRLRLLGSALGWIVLAPLGLVPLVLVAVTALLVPVSVGLPLVLWSFALVRAFAGASRRRAARVLGRPVERPYRPGEPGGLFAHLKRVVRDPATWRDLAWLVVNVTAGLVLRVLVVAAFVAAIAAFALPLVWPLLPSSAGPVWVGVVRVSDQSGANLVAVEGGLVLVLWWLFAPALVRADATLARWLLGPTERSRLARRVDELAETRAVSVDTQAAELRRIERDLHDGVQARLVALGMSLGMAEEVVASDPAAARELLAEAKLATGTALAELRDVVRGIHPPVLADRGLDGAVRALALATPVPTEVETELGGRLPPPVESAAYFAVAEALTNVIKHSRASRCWVHIRRAGGSLEIVVGDDGAGGADPARGSGLEGIRRRLAPFDGTLHLDSPPGGPTMLTMELPCESSSPRTSPSSGTA
jgi:signal transduction histidine kinase